MATERLPMKQALEILRLKWELRLSNRHAARSAGVSPATVVNVVRRAVSAQIKSYAQAKALGEEALEASEVEPIQWTPGREVISAVKSLLDVEEELEKETVHRRIQGGSRTST